MLLVQLQTLPSSKSLLLSCIYKPTKISTLPTARFIWITSPQIFYRFSWRGQTAKVKTIFIFFWNLTQKPSWNLVICAASSAAWCWWCLQSLYFAILANFQVQILLRSSGFSIYLSLFAFILFVCVGMQEFQTRFRIHSMKTKVTGLRKKYTHTTDSFWCMVKIPL